MLGTWRFTNAVFAQLTPHRGDCVFGTCATALNLMQYIFTLCALCLHKVAITYKKRNKRTTNCVYMILNKFSPLCYERVAIEFTKRAGHETLRTILNDIVFHSLCDGQFVCCLNDSLRCVLSVFRFSAEKVNELCPPSKRVFYTIRINPHLNALTITIDTKYGKLKPGTHSIYNTNQRLHIHRDNLILRRKACRYPIQQ